jgi:Putative HNHc nuclease
MRAAAAAALSFNAALAQKSLATVLIRPQDSGGRHLQIPQCVIDSAAKQGLRRFWVGRGGERVVNRQVMQRVFDSTLQPGRIDKSVLTINTPKRYRDKGHLRFVAQQTCVLCGRKPAEAHHIRFAQPRALARKSSDEFAVPLCRAHHRAVHRVGDEKAWWQQAGVDPIKVARKLWKLTRLGGPRNRPATPTQDTAAEPASNAELPTAPVTA